MAKTYSLLKVADDDPEGKPITSNDPDFHKKHEFLLKIPKFLI